VAVLPIMGDGLRDSFHRPERCDDRAMLIRHETLRRIEAGEVDTVFRRQRRPTVKAGAGLRAVAARPRAARSALIARCARAIARRAVRAPRADA
jgi:hypothetical protein